MFSFIYHSKYPISSTNFTTNGQSILCKQETVSFYDESNLSLSYINYCFMQLAFSFSIHPSSLYLQTSKNSIPKKCHYEAMRHSNLKLFKVKHKSFCFLLKNRKRSAQTLIALGNFVHNGLLASFLTSVAIHRYLYTVS